MKVTADGKSGFAIFILCAILLFGIIPAYVESGPARLMPNLSVIWIGIFTFWLFFSGIRSNSREKEVEAALIDRMDLGHGESRVVLLLFLIWGIHIFLLPLWGFYLGSFLTLAASMHILGKRARGPLLVWAASPLLGMYLLFEMALQLQLPKGKLTEIIISAISGS